MYTQKKLPALDAYIKNKFQLFKGVRTKDEDEAIYLRITDLLFSEILKFLEEELTYVNKIKLRNDLSLIHKSVESSDRQFEIVLTTLFKYVSYISYGSLKIERRLEHYVNFLAINMNYK